LAGVEMKTRWVEKEDVGLRKSRAMKLVRFI
jgi:hypothetical protein